jgi:hypothetical protein
MGRFSYKGIYNPDHPKKWKGDVNNIVYRSGLEHRYFKKLESVSS